MGLFDRLKQKTQVKKADALKKASAQERVEAKNAEAPLRVTRAFKAGGDAYRVLMRPLLSEKAVSRETRGVYTFVVHTHATKHMVKDAVRSAYGIMPTQVRMITVEGKKKHFGRRSGRRSDWKKAIVTLPKGKTITVHEGV